MPEFEPHTRNEALLNAIRENTGGGTGSVDFEPRTRSEYLLNEIRKNTEGKERFIITLTPDSADYSGTMDKTVREIDDAVAEGRDVWFRILVLGDEVFAPLMIHGHSPSSAYPSFGTFVVYDPASLFIDLYTGITDDGDQDTYNTILYQLTPVQ